MDIHETFCKLMNILEHASHFLNMNFQYTIFLNTFIDLLQALKRTLSFIPCSKFWASDLLFDVTFQAVM